MNTPRKATSPKKGIRTPMPFCPLCFRYMTPAEARHHSKHARVIRWPKNR